MLLSIIVLPGKNTRHLLNKGKECMSMVGWFTKDLKICSIWYCQDKILQYPSIYCKALGLLWTIQPCLTAHTFFSFVEKVSGLAMQYLSKINSPFSGLNCCFCHFLVQGFRYIFRHNALLLALLVCFVFSLSVYFLLFQSSFTKFSSFQGTL